MRRKSSRTAAKTAAEKTDSPKPSRKSRRGRKSFSSDDDSDHETLAKYGNKTEIETKGTSEDEEKSIDLARAKDSEENNDMDDDSTQGKFKISNESSTATREGQTESENAQVTAQSPQAYDTDVNEQNINTKVEETQQSSGELSASIHLDSSEERSMKKYVEHSRPHKDSTSSREDYEYRKSSSPEQSYRIRRSFERPANLEAEVQEKVHQNNKGETEKHDEVISNQEENSESIDQDKEQNTPEELKKEEQKQKKITLRRSVDDPIATEEKKSYKKITLKRNIDPSNIEKKEQSDESNKQSSTDGEWGSVYEKTDSVESKEKTQKSTSRRITLNRSTTVDETLTEKEKDTIVIKRRISLAENSAPKMSEVSPQVKKRSLSERSSTDAPVKPPKLCTPIKLNRTMFDHDSTTDTMESESSDENTAKKRRKWGPMERSIHTRIDADFFKDICPALELVSENEVNLAISERRKSRHTSFEDSDQEEKKSASDVEKDGSDQNIIALNRKISIVDDTASKLRPPPSPAKNAVSEVLFITNLVRPFTVKQLKELLERTGKIKSEGFWTDRIKSKCYVQYESVEDAEATRNALHGINWPIGNGKKLNIEYATEEDLEKAKNPPPPAIVKEKTPEKENKFPERERTEAPRDHENEHAPPERDPGHEWGGREPRDRRMRGEREWDVGKEGVRPDRSRSRSRDRARHGQRHGRRTLTPEDYHRKRVRHEEPPPQKMMDDLFLKTKATPSIYWQPLTPEEIAMKQQQRLVRMEEHKRRLEETRQRPRNPLAPPYRRR